MIRQNHSTGALGPRDRVSSRVWSSRACTLKAVTKPQFSSGLWSTRIVVWSLDWRPYLKSKSNFVPTRVSPEILGYMFRREIIPEGLVRTLADRTPPDEYARHHVKEASFYGVDTWSTNLVYKLPPSDSPSSHLLKVHFSGIKEKAMWPGKKGEKDEGGRAMALFEDLGEYVEKRFRGTVGVLLLGCLGGVATV